MNFSELGRTQFTQSDGAKWNAFFDNSMNPDHHYLLVTSSGREELLHPPLGQAAMRKLFTSYRQSEKGVGHPSIRDFLGSGQQAAAYGLTDRYAVREVVGNPPFYQTLSDVTRTNELANIVDGGIPRWIDVPPIFAVYSDARALRQYTFMKRIDSGLTVEDIADFDNANERSNQRAIRELGRKPTVDESNKVTELYNKSKQILDTVITARGRNPKELLTDWAMRNVLVDIVQTPVAGENMILHIIDQN